MNALIFFVIFGGGAVLYGVIESKFARRRPARGGARRGTRKGTTTRRWRPSAPAPEFPEWSEKVARLFLEGGSCRWE